MINLAFKSVWHGRRRYLPVVIAVGVSGLLMVAQVALAFGAFQMAAAPVRNSTADLWIGPAEARAVDQSTGLSPFAASALWLEPEIARIEPWYDPEMAMLSTSPEPDPEEGKPAVVTGLDLAEGALTLARQVTPDLRARLRAPGTVILGQADAGRLGLSVGDTLSLNGQRMRVVGVVDELRSLFGIPVLTSHATRRSLGAGSTGGVPAFYLVKVKDGAHPTEVALQLSSTKPSLEYRVWAAQDLAAATVRVWALESGAGTAFMASAGMALAITLMVVNQTLGAAVAGNLREYAALRAYGVSFRRVQGIVLRQGLYVSLAALVLTAAASLVLIVVLNLLHIPAQMPLPMAALLAGVLAGVVMVSNLMAVRRLRRADPAALLR